MAVKKIDLADAKYEKFYLPATKSIAAKKAEKLSRQLNRAALVANQSIGKKKWLCVDDLIMKSRAPRSRLEM